MRARSLPGHGLQRPVIRLVALLLAGLVAACDPATAPVTPSAPPTAVSPAPTSSVGGGSFRYGIGEPTAIVPPLAVTADDHAVVDALFDSLTAWDDAGRPVPSAASEWTVNDTQTEWTFVLRPGATFHDGRPVRAQDFVAAWTTLVRTGGAGYLLADVVGHAATARGDVASLPGARAVDDGTLRVSLVRPRSDLAAVVGHPALGPLAPEGPVAAPEAAPSGAPTEPPTVAAPEGDGSTVDPSDMPVGNGPFVLTEPWARGDFIRAASWEGWRNGTRAVPGIAEVVFRISDLDTNYLAFTQGRRDLTVVPTDALASAAEDYPARGGAWEGPGLITGGRPEVYLLAMNRQVAPYDDRLVREAVSLVLDRARLAAENEGGNLVPSTSLLPPSLPGARIGVCDLCTFNPSGAADRLAQADVSQLSIAYNAGGGHDRIRNVLRAGLSDIGVSLVSNGRGVAPGLAEYQARLATGEVGLFRLPLVADVPSGLSVLYPLLHSSQVPEAGGLNYLRYDDPTVDSLLDQAARTANVSARQALLLRVESIALNRDVVVAPVFSYQQAVVVSGRVRNLRYGPFGLATLTDVVLIR